MWKKGERVRSCRSSLLLQYTVVINTEEFEEMMNPTDVVVQVDERKKKGVEVGGREEVVVLRVSGCVFRGMRVA